MAFKQTQVDAKKKAATQCCLCLVLLLLRCKHIFHIFIHLQFGTARCTMYIQHAMTLHMMHASMSCTKEKRTKHDVYGLYCMVYAIVHYDDNHFVLLYLYLSTILHYTVFFLSGRREQRSEKKYVVFSRMKYGIRSTLFA